MNQGYFVTFEGGEGSGKSTQIQLLLKELEKVGHKVLVFREPGGTRLSEEIRGLLLDPESVMVDTAELLLFEASRAQLVAERIRPALAEGFVVLCDRFFDSSTAYQSFARGLKRKQIEFLNHLATQGLRPSTTFLLDIDPLAGIVRATNGGGPDRLEQEANDFHNRVRNGFLAIAAQEPERVVVVDASRTIEEIAEEIWKIFLDRYKEVQDGRSC